MLLQKIRKKSVNMSQHGQFIVFIGKKNRFIYDLMYNRKIMSTELFDWLVREKIADGTLISQWRKPGYEILCSMLAIERSSHIFGTNSHCRVPIRFRPPSMLLTPNPDT